jgi:hypothetical protein
MKYINRLRDLDKEAPQPRASRPIVRPRKNTLSQKKKGVDREDILFI